MTTSTQTPIVDQYMAVNDVADAAKAALKVAATAAERAAQLGVLADCDLRQAELHTATWGPQPIDEGDRDMAESLALSAMLFQALADAETAQAIGQPRTPAANAEVEAAAGNLLDAYVAATTDGQRADLLEDLNDAVLPIVGGQAAEVWWCLAGMYDDLDTAQRNNER